jgi:phage shock protein PspC (stress-responsive transcriptional regulator)
MSKKFYRVKEGKKIFGLCNGLAEYTDTDVVLWRLILIALFFTPFPSILFYIIGTIVTESK